MVTAPARIAQPIFRPPRRGLAGPGSSPDDISVTFTPFSHALVARDHASGDPGCGGCEGARWEPREGLRERCAGAFRNPALTCGNSTLRHFLYRFVAKLESPAIASSSAR